MKKLNTLIVRLKCQIEQHIFLYTNEYDSEGLQKVLHVAASEILVRDLGIYVCFE